MKLTAKWIWKKQKEYNTYNDAIIARKTFRISAFTQASAYVTADSFYRLKINGQWVNDGPARAWPEHFKYDVVDVTSYLQKGRNTIEIVARYYGCGDFHRVCRQAGLLAQFDVKKANGTVESIITDSEWEVAPLRSLVKNTPKSCIQQGPYELYDARLEGKARFTKATELYEASDGPWKGLTPRDVKLLTKEPVNFKSFMGASVVRHEGENYCFPAVRLLFPGVIEAQSYVGAACGFATVVKVTKKCMLNAWSGTLKITIDGTTKANGKYILQPGRHLLLTFVKKLPDEQGSEIHDKERSLRVVCSEKYILNNPLDAKHENPWAFIGLKQFAYVHDDLDSDWTIEKNPDLAEKAQGYAKLIKKAFREVVDTRSFKRILGEFAECKPSAEMLLEDPFWKFSDRKVVGDGTPLIDSPDALMYDNGEWTTIKPSKHGDIELGYDLGEQRMGYFQIEMLAEAGVEVQFSGIEHIAKDGGIQYTNLITTTLNGMNYIAKEGLNRFTSFKRRSGRFIYITLRNQKKPVKIRLARMIESTYPVDYLGSFSCSDARLDQIWDISTRTLKLCMEDTFTDCPLYEQTLWVGDARNESLFAYPVFGGVDISRSCIDLAGQSLERFPMVSCQLPSAWDSIIPVWSFLWGISIWDHYWHTGDEAFLKKRFKLVIKNLKGAEKQIEESGLFSATMWNLFDWAGIDQNQKIVLHNSLFMVGAIDAALKCAKVVGNRQHDKWLKSMCKGLVDGINALWNGKRKSYPDSIRDDGTISPMTCRHTSFLSVLYGVANPGNARQAEANTIQPLKGMTEVGSPFAILYLYEALEKINADDIIMKSIYDNYLPMLEVGATTVWETFPNSPWSPDGTRFPTRSHCHAWSSAPAYFLNRIVLGVRQSAPGGTTFTVSPQLSGLTWASGRTASAKGIVDVGWELDGKELRVTIKVPERIKCKFVKNASMNGLSIFVNGKKPPAGSL